MLKKIYKLSRDKITQKGYECGMVELINGDVLDEKYSYLLAKSDFIFMNNLCYSVEMETILLEKCMHSLRCGTRVVTMKELFPRCDPTRNPKRYESQPVTIFRYPWITEKITKKNAVSWTCNPVSYYIYTVDRPSPSEDGGAKKTEETLKITDENKKEVEKTVTASKKKSLSKKYNLKETLNNTEEINEGNKVTDVTNSTTTPTKLVRPEETETNEPNKCKDPQPPKVVLPEETETNEPNKSKDPPPIKVVQPEETETSFSNKSKDSPPIKVVQPEKTKTNFSNKSKVPLLKAVQPEKTETPTKVVRTEETETPTKVVRPEETETNVFGNILRDWTV